MKNNSFEESKRVSTTKGFLRYRNGIDSINVVNGITWIGKTKIGKIEYIDQKFIVLKQLGSRIEGKKFITNDK